MTISTTTARTTYDGNGITTAFPIPFRFLVNGDITVVEVSSTGVETAKALTTHYTLTGAGDDAGGSCTMLVAPANGTRLIIYRDTDIVQETDYISGDPFPAETHERALDRLTMIAQEIGSDADRAIKVPVGDSSSLSTTLPAAANRLDKFIVFDATTGETELSTVTQTQVASAVAAAYSAGGSTADAVVFVPEGTGAVSTTVQEHGRKVITAHNFMTAAQITASGLGTYADLTAELQAALDAAAGKRLLIPKGAYGVSFVGWGTFGVALDVPSDIEIEFEPGATIQALAHDAEQYQIMRVWDRENVTIIRPNINGRKDLNAETTGEFGIGIDVRGSARVRIESPNISNCWGDGIYIGEGTSTDYCSDCVVTNPIISGCRRQGISIISVDGLDINGGNISDIAGTAPEAGIDIEPNNNDNVLRNIKIDGLKTSGCTAGIAIYLAAWDGAVAKTINVTISNHEDDGSTTAFTAGGCDPGANVINGAILNLDPLYVNTGERAVYGYEWASAGPVIDIVRPVVVNPNRDAGSGVKYNTPFVMLRDTGSVLTYPIGNLRIFEPSVILTSGSIPALFLFQDVVNDASLPADNLERCHFIDPILLSGLGTGDMLKGILRGKGFISDRYQQWMRTATGSETLTDFSIGHIRAPASSAVFTLSATYYPAGGPDLIFSTASTDSCIIDPPASGGFIGETVDYRLQSVTAHSYLRLRPVGSNFFQIIERIGLWSAIV